MTRIIGLFNQASSQGKTTLTMNIGYHLVERGHRVLAVDMDTHAWLTKQLQGDRTGLSPTIVDVLLEKERPQIFSSPHRLAFIPASEQLSTLEANLARSQDRQFRLKTRLEPLHSAYDFILLDCPPNLGLLSVMCLVASTHVLVPIETTEKGIQGAKDFLLTFQNIRLNLNPSLKFAGVVPTKYDSRRSHHKLKLETIQKSFTSAKIPVYPAIGLYTDFENAWDEAEPLAVYNSGHGAVEKLQHIAHKLEHL